MNKQKYGFEYYSTKIQHLTLQLHELSIKGFGKDEGERVMMKIFCDTLMSLLYELDNAA